MSKSRKRKKGFTTKNTHIPKRVTDFVNRVSNHIDTFTDGDVAVLEAKLLTASDDDLWNEFTTMLSEGYYLPFLEKFRKEYLSDKPHLNKPITNVECMLLGVTLMDSEGAKKDFIPHLRNRETLMPFTMSATLKLISQLRERVPMNQIQNIEKNVNWEE